MTGTIAAWGQAEAWGWERREELAQALAAETTDWLDWLCDEPETWEILFRAAIAQGTARPGALREERLAWAGRIARAEIRSRRAAGDWVDDETTEHGLAVAGELIAVAWALGRWDWVVGARTAYVDGELVELDPDSPSGRPGERCTCGGARERAQGEPCQHLVLAAILYDALGAPARGVWS